MPITYNLTRGRTVTFPDGTSEEDITRILDRDYPLEGVDIDEMVMSDPDFAPTFEQYQLFQQHAYDKDESMFAGMGEGLEHIAGVGWEAAKELPGMGWDELKYQAMKQLVPGGRSFMPPVSPRTASTLAESGMQGTRELLGMAAQSADPDSIFFRWKSLMEGRGKATDKGRYEQFKDAREFQRRTLQMEDGRTMSLADIAQLIQKNPEAPEGVLGGLHFDFDDPHTQKRMKELGWEKGMLPEELVNTDFVRGAKYVTDPSMLIPGFGALGKGATLGTKAAGATLRGTGKVMRGAGGGVYRAGTAAAEWGSEAVTKATGVSPGMIRGGAAAVGVTTPTGQLLAGGLIGARATEAVGTVLARAGEVMASGPTRRGVFKQVAHDLEKGTLEYALARGIGMLDKPIAIVGQVAEAGIHGGLIGGGLGFLHAGPEGFGPGFGAGFGMGGTIGGVVGVGQLARGKNAFTAKTANDVLNQIKTMEPEQAAMFNEIVAREGVDVAANILDWAAFMEGRLGDGAVKYFWNPHEARGSAPLPSMTAGKPTIEINLAKMDSDYTVGHEIVHGLDHIEDLQPIMHQIRQEIAGMWIDGNMVEQGGMTLTALETRYIEYMNLLAKGEGEKRARHIISRAERLIIGRGEKKSIKLSKEEVSRIHAEEHRNALEKFTKDHGTAEKRALYVADEIMAEQMARLIKGAGPGAGLYGFDSVTRRVLDHSLLKYKGTVLGGMIGRLTEWGIDPYDSMLFKNLEQAPPELRAMLRNLIRARKNLGKEIEVSDARPDIITKRELKHRLPELKRQGLVKQNEKGDWVFKDDKEVEAAEVASEEALVSILSREDPDGKSVERVVNEDTGKAEYIMTGSRFSPAQLAAIAGHPDILPTVKQSLGRWSKAIDEGGILNVTYYAATKRIKNRFTGRYRSKYGSGIKKSNRNLLPFTEEMSNVGNLFGKGIDWTLLTNDIIALAVKKKLSPWANNPRAFINDFTEYLTNLSAGAKQRSYEKFGDAKAEFMREILLKQHRGGSKYVKSFRFDRMDGIISTGEYNVVHDPALRGKIPFVGQEHPKVSGAGKPIRMSEQAWAGSQARLMPDNAAYMKAAKKGDTDTAQRMVDQAAKAAGYEIAATHRTSTDDITQFDHSIAQDRLGRNIGLGLGRGKFYFSGRHDGWVNPDNPVNVEAHLKVLNPISEKAYKAIVAEEGGVKDMGDLPGRSRERDAAIAKADAKVKAMGHDGIVQAFRDSDGQIVEYGQIAVFDSNQIKSADPITRDNAGNIIPLSERFQSSSADIRYMPDVGGQDALGMFSAAERATVNLKQNKGSGEQMLSMLKKAGVKDEELSALGLDKFLEGNRKVTKDEIIDHLVENQITVEETVLGEPAALSGGGLHPAPRSTKHPSLVEPGAVEGSYRELLLRLPVAESSQKYWVRYNRAGITTGPWTLEEANNVAARRPGLEVRRGPDLRDDTSIYTGGHYGEYPNTLANIRFNAQQSKYGKTLSIQEIQSDWHQVGRKKGYRDEKVHARLGEELKVAKSEYEKAYAEWHEALKSGGGFDMRGRKAEAAGKVRRAEEALESIGTVPDAPFKTSWHELAMKRMIAYAVQNNYDAISWTTGETQIARYDLSKKVKSVRWERRPDGKYNLATELLGNSETRFKEGMTPEAIEEYIGKDVLEHIENSRGTERAERQHVLMFGEGNVGVLHKLDLKLGGEFHKNLYDRKLVRIKTWKKLGLKVESDFLLTEKTRKMVFEVYDERAGTERTAPTVSRHDSLEGAAAATRGNPNLLHREAWTAGKGAAPAHLVGFTPEVNAKVLDTGLSRFMPDAAAPNTLKNQLGWSLIKGQGSKWRVYKPNGTLAGIAATKASAERMFRTKYKRELRKADK